MIETIVIGGGIAGLYYCHTHRNTENCKLLEKSNRIGGRIGQYMFNGINVVSGAGIGRCRKDKLLKKLLKELGLSYGVSTSKINYLIPGKINILETLPSLIEKYNINWTGQRSRTTFRDFLKKEMADKYQEWVASCGYTDYLNADVVDTIYDYGFDDNVGGNKSMAVPWNDLIKNISKGLNIVLNVDVKRIDKTKNDKFKIEVSKKEIYIADKVVLAVPSPQLYKLLKMDIYLEIPPQPFCRYYIKLDKTKSKDFISNVSGFTVVRPPLQKIIKFTDDVYMISYSDNKSAQCVHNLDSGEMEKLVFDTTGYPIKILDKMVFYFEVGTHYYKPLNDRWKDREEFIDFAQNPTTGIYVVGESVSRNQGWTEGALESVENLKMKFISKSSQFKLKWISK